MITPKEKGETRPGKIKDNRRAKWQVNTQKQDQKSNDSFQESNCIIQKRMAHIEIINKEEGFAELTNLGLSRRPLLA